MSTIHSEEHYRRWLAQILHQDAGEVVLTISGFKCGEFTIEEKQKDPVINRVLLLANPA